jgi:hypothetical protein
MADVEDALEFFEQRLLIVEIVGPPVERVTCRRLEATFALSH